MGKGIKFKLVVRSERRRKQKNQQLGFKCSEDE